MQIIHTKYLDYCRYEKCETVRIGKGAAAIWEEDTKSVYHFSCYFRVKEARK